MHTQERHKNTVIDGESSERVHYSRWESGVLTPPGLRWDIPLRVSCSHSSQSAADGKAEWPQSGAAASQDARVGRLHWGFCFFFQLTSRKCETFVRNTYKLFLLGNAPTWILSAMQSDPYRVESLSRTTASLSTVCACDIRKIPQFKALKARHQPWSLGPPAIFCRACFLDLPNTHRHLTPLIPLCDPSRGLCHL